MKIVIAIDSLKGSLTSLEAGQAIREGILSADPSAEICVCPLADGGEGTAEALTIGMGGRFERISVTGPLREPVNCVYGILPERNTAVVEMAAASGLPLIPENRQNPMETTTFGVGEIIRDAVNKGCRDFIVGIGGSATNDGGTGMLQALGFDLLKKDGKPIPPGAKGLSEIYSISDQNALPELKDCRFKIACDVKNPLCGPNGASAVYGPQKGATPDMIREMDSGLKHFSELTRKLYPDADENRPGAGAAGGLGFAFLSYLHARLESGIKIVSEETGLERLIENSDVVVTGEGRLDEQTVMGKAPVGVAAIAKKYKKPVIAFCGSAAPDARSCNESGIDAYFPILQSVTTLEEAMRPETAIDNLRRTAEQVFRLIRAFAP